MTPDYFLIIDADEIYEGAALERLKEYASRHRRPFYRVACVRYFKRWNYRIDGLEWLMALVRSDRRLPYLRLRKVNLVRRAAARVPGVPRGMRAMLRGFDDVPSDVATFHHGSYVGPRRRIEEKPRPSVMPPRCGPDGSRTSGMRGRRNGATSTPRIRIASPARSASTR